MAVKVGDLKSRNAIERRGNRLFVVPQPVLYCTRCGAQFSANAGDYFMADPAHVFKHCRRNMVLAVQRLSFTEVQA